MVSLFVEEEQPMKDKKNGKNLRHRGKTLIGTPKGTYH